MSSKHDYLVSIIIPVYNVSKYIDECIESLISQTYANIEIILVDDGSTDDSGSICDSYKDKDNRVIVIHKENSGISDARNVGLDIAKGEYYLFVDSDDVVHQNYVEYLLDAVLISGCKVAQSRFKHIEANDKAKTDSALEHKQPVIISGRDGCGLIYKAGGVSATVVWDKIYHKSIWEKRRFPSGKFNEDLFMTFELLYSNETIALISDELYYYRKNPNSVTSVPLSLRNLYYFEALDRHLEFYSSQNDNDMFEKCIANYLYMAVLYTHLVYVKSPPQKKELLSGLKSIVAKAISLCKEKKIHLYLEYRCYPISPFCCSLYFELKRRLRGKTKIQNP